LGKINLAVKSHEMNKTPHIRYSLNFKLKMCLLIRICGIIIRKKIKAE
jgi:hypothetical protein